MVTNVRGYDRTGGVEQKLEQVEGLRQKELDAILTRPMTDCILPMATGTLYAKRGF